MGKAEGITPQLLALDLGLDLTTPKPAAVPGSLLSCLNYERSDAAGLSRIYGFEFYDGQTPADTSSFKVVDFTGPHDLVLGNHVGAVETFNGQMGVVDNLVMQDATGALGVTKDTPTTFSELMTHASPFYGVIPSSSVTKNIHIGTVVEVVSTTRVVIACVNEDALYPDVVMLKLSPTTGVHTVTGVVANVYNFNSIVYDPTANYNYRIQYSSVLRDIITQLNGACGLVWYNDILHAVAVSTVTTEAEVGTLWRARTIQQLLDDNTGAARVLGWEELNLGYSTQNFPDGDQVAVNSLPTAKALEIAQSQHQFLVANFYGSETTTSLYGVNGVSRAFVYDGEDFTFINTGLDFSLDKPRHIAKFQDRLVLGYTNGSILLSVVGTPTDFSGVLGAAEIAFGDRIVGLQVLAGEALGVFCENSIYYLDKDLGVHVISPNTGCIEYTLAAMSRPYYCSAAGIMTLEQTDKYGDFLGVSISERVDPWLRPRLKRIQGRYFSYPAVMGNMIVRTKNQYRLFFRDGYVLTMSVTPNGYIFTTQQYLFDEEAEDPRTGTFLTLASCSQMAQDGTEKLFAVHHNSRLPFNLNRVVEMDVGWGFAGKAIGYHFETNASSSDPFTYSRLSKIRLHGLSKGKASLKVQTSGTNDGFVDDYNVTQDQYLALPRNTALYKDSFTDTTDIKDLADSGLSFKIKITGRELLVPEPPHVCQLITTLNKPGGRIDA